MFRLLWKQCAITPWSLHRGVCRRSWRSPRGRPTGRTAGRSWPYATKLFRSMGSNSIPNRLRLGRGSDSSETSSHSRRQAEAIRRCLRKSQICKFLAASLRAENGAARVLTPPPVLISFRDACPGCYSGSSRLNSPPQQTPSASAGEALITGVIERVQDHGVLAELVVATDAEAVVKVAEKCGVRAVLTSGSHSNGTDRVAEVATRAEFRMFDVIANIQGDEPFLSREALVGSLGRVEQGDDIGTAAAPLEPHLAL